MKKQVNPQIRQIEGQEHKALRAYSEGIHAFVGLGLICVNLRNLRTKKGF